MCNIQCRNRQIHFNHRCLYPNRMIQVQQQLSSIPLNVRQLYYIDTKSAFVIIGRYTFLIEPNHVYPKHVNLGSRETHLNGIAWIPITLTYSSVILYSSVGTTGTMHFIIIVIGSYYIHFSEHIITAHRVCLVEAYNCMTTYYNVLLLYFCRWQMDGQLIISVRRSTVAVLSYES